MNTHFTPHFTPFTFLTTITTTTTTLQHDSALSSDSPRQAQFFADKLVAADAGGWFNALLLGRAHAAVGELRRAVLCLESVTCSKEGHGVQR